jgi:hypothetical protein
MQQVGFTLYTFNPLTTSDRHKLDRLIGTALVDSHVRHRLLVSRDEALLADFDLGEPARRWLLDINARTLTELARVVCAAS